MYIAQTTSHDDGKHLTSAKRGGVSGVASLDASSLQLDAERPASVSGHIAATAPHSGHRISANVAYTGNGGVNRAIAHGLGRTPVFAIFVGTGGDNGYYALQTISTSQQGFKTGTGATPITTTVTAWDDTNIYISGGINENTQGYRLAAVG